MRAVVVAITVIGIITGCSPYTLGESTPRLTDAYVEGTWSKAGPDGVIAAYHFLSDGRFVASNIPQFRVPYCACSATSVNWTRLMTGTGTWSIDRSDDQDPPTLDLAYDPPSVATFDPESASMTSGEYVELLSVETHGRKGLFFFAGDADEQYRFTLHKHAVP